MDTEQTIKLQRIKQRVEATDTNMSGSAFTDIAVADLMAAYRAANPKVG
jgi:hypothetical protein